MQISNLSSASMLVPVPGDQLDSRRQADERARQAPGSVLTPVRRLPLRESIVQGEVLSNQSGHAGLSHRYQAAVIAGQKDALPANRAVAEYVITEQQDLLRGSQNLIDVFA